MGLMEAQREVTGMVHSGTPFDAIEDRIQVIPGLVDNERSGYSRHSNRLKSRLYAPCARLG